MINGYESCAQNWADIPGFAGYQASDLGGVRNSRGLIMRQRAVDGARQVNIGKATVQVHHAVLRAFTGIAPKGFRPKHLNGDRTDNRLENLAWTGRPR